jgi:amino acid permease
VAKRQGLAARHPALATFGVMVIAIVGGGVLALPTALAGFGPQRAALVVVVMGLVNLATLSSLAGAISRSTAPSSGRGRLTTLTSEHLGESGALIALVASVLLWFGLLVVDVLGASGSLAGIAGPVWLWAIAITAVIAALVFAQARDLFIASAMAVAVTNLVILFVMIVIVASHVDADLLTSAPKDIDTGGTSALELVFGTVLFAYFGHTALFSVAPEVARADPSGRALRRGATAAMIAAIIINAGWVMVCLGTVPAERFANETSTGVLLLAEYTSPILEPLGALFAVLALGFAGLNAAFALGDVIGERLPGLRRLSTILKPGSSVEIYEPNSIASITIASAVEDGEQIIVARGRRGRRQVREVISGSSWNGQAMLEELGVTRRHVVLRVNVDGEAVGGVVLSIESTLPLTEHQPAGGRAALLGSDDIADQLTALLVQAAVRQPAPATELSATVATATGLNDDVVSQRLSDLVSAGRLTVRSTGVVHAVLGSRHRAKTALVRQLYAELAGETDTSDQTAPPTSLRREAFAHGVWRRLALIAPAPLALVTVLGLVASGTSFASVLDLVAMAGIVLLAGVMPLMLGMSLRGRAERAVRSSRLVGPPLQIALLALFMAVTIVYAVFIYEQWYQRLVAATAFGVLAFTIVASFRAKAYDRRSTILLEPDGPAGFRVTALDGGQAVDARVVQYEDNHRRSLMIDIPSGLTPPLLLVALDGEGVPAALGEWTISIDGSTIASGYLEDSAGDIVEWPKASGPLRCDWLLR